MSQVEATSRLVLSIVDFLRNELTDPDLSFEDIDNIQIAIEGLQSVYDLSEINETQRRSLLDMFMQVSNPVSVRDRLRAESLKEDGNTKMENGQYEEAEQNYSQAIELDRFNAIFYCNRAGARLKLQQYYEATADCRHALILNPDYSKAYGRMGQAYALMDSHRRAARCFRQALELEPENETYRNNLSVAEQRIVEDPVSLMGLLIQGLLSSVLGGGTGGDNGADGSGGGGMPGPSFVIVSEPHTADECESGHAPGEANNGSKSETMLQGDQTSDSDDSEEDVIHFRVLFGIPIAQEEQDTCQISGDDVNSMVGTRTADTEAAPKQQQETPTDSGTLNEKPENKNPPENTNPPELSEPEKLVTKEISESIENADGIRAVAKSDNNASTHTADTEAAPKQQEETPTDSRTLNEKPENKNPSENKNPPENTNPPELSEPEKLVTKEISEFIENVDGIGAVAKSDDNASEKTSDGSMDKSMLGESKEQSQSQGLESKDTAKKKSDRSPIFNLSDISSFFKNLGRSSTTAEVDKSNDTRDSNKGDSEKKETEKAAKVSVNKEFNKKPDDKSKGNQEK